MPFLKVACENSAESLSFFLQSVWIVIVLWSFHKKDSFVFASDRPIVGVVSLELTGILKTKFPLHDAYIAASYVKAIESSGGRVVPIKIGQSEEYYRSVPSKRNY